jgi:phosphoenolpyruvate carboxykinase (ATP)
MRHLEGKLDKVPYRKDKLFGFEIFQWNVPDVPEDVFEPSNAWGDKKDYWRKYDALVARYIENFKLFQDGVPSDILQAGPKRLKEVE